MNNFAHLLKILPEYFEAVLSGAKTFEIRKNDRVPQFNPGDDVILQEWNQGYTGRSASFRIGYLTHYEQKPGYVVFSILPLTIQEGRKDG